MAATAAFDEQPDCLACNDRGCRNCDPARFLTHNPCCSAHNASLDCDTFRRTHTVEPGSDCCATWTETNPYGGWVPRGCPAGFSSECASWTSTSPCRCLLMTLPFNEAQRLTDGESL